jgi:hypothetical protein
MGQLLKHTHPRARQDVYHCPATTVMLRCANRMFAAATWGVHDYLRHGVKCSSLDPRSPSTAAILPDAITASGHKRTFRNVRTMSTTPKSRHCRARPACPLCAISRHRSFIRSSGRWGRRFWRSSGGGSARTASIFPEEITASHFGEMVARRKRPWTGLARRRIAAPKVLGVRAIL